jgi:hypothetical protein
MPEIYQQIAERDTFDIFIRNLRDLLTPQDIQPANPTTRKKKRKPEELEQIVQVCLEVLEQYMEHEPQHLRNFLASEGEKVAKYPSCEFLLDQFELAPPPIASKVPPTRLSLPPSSAFSSALTPTPSRTPSSARY